MPIKADVGSGMDEPAGNGDMSSASGFPAENVSEEQDADVAGEQQRAPYILLHGFAQSSRSWADTADALHTRGHAVYAPDLMRAGSKGESEDLQSRPEVDEVPDFVGDILPDAQTAIDDAYKALRQAQGMDDLCCAVAELVCTVAQVHDHPPVLVGYSMGGRVALETLVRTDRALPLSGTVFESAGLGPRDDADRTALAKRSRQWLAKLQAEGVEAFVDWWESLPLFATQRLLEQDVRDRVRAERIGCGVDGLACMLAGTGQHLQSYADDSLAALQDAAARGIAVVYLAGEHDDRYCAIAEAIRASSPLVQVHIVDDAGHNIHLERLDAFIGSLPF